MTDESFYCSIWFFIAPGPDAGDGNDSTTPKATPRAGIRVKPRSRRSPRPRHLTGGLSPCFTHLVV